MLKSDHVAQARWNMGHVATMDWRSSIHCEDTDTATFLGVWRTGLLFVRLADAHGQREMPVQRVWCDVTQWIRMGAGGGCHRRFSPTGQDDSLQDHVMGGTAGRLASVGTWRVLMLSPGGVASILCVQLVLPKPA